MSLYFDRRGQPISFEQHALLFGTDFDNRRVALDKTALGSVSTVHLVIDHSFGRPGPPVIFETLVRDQDGNELDMVRYSTEDEALRGHEQLVFNYLRPSTGVVLS